MGLFIQRNGVVSHANFTADETDIFCGTVFHGELLKDGSYIVFDLIAARGYSYTSQPLPIRLSAARDAVAKLSSNVASSVIKVKEFFERKYFL